MSNPILEFIRAFLAVSEISFAFKVVYYFFIKRNGASIEVLAHHKESGRVERAREVGAPRGGNITTE